MAGIQLAFLFFLKFNFFWLLFLVSLFALDFLIYVLERKGRKINLIRFGSSLVLIIIINFFSLSHKLEFNRAAADLISFLEQMPLTSGLNGNNMRITNVIFSGFLFILNEVNFLIRFFFEIFKLIPQKNTESGGLDEKEYNAGRVIGMLERIFVFLFVILGNFAAIGFIIAAKGFTRFKDLDNRDFAEYVLIGTLLSTLTAVLAAFFVKSLL